MRILGLDLGVASIGWSLISTDSNGDPEMILGMGSRIVPLSSADTTNFTRGQSVTLNADRTTKRSSRKTNDRYKMRREALTAELKEKGMLPDESLIKLPPLPLWELRARAATQGQKLSLPEIGRVLYHINQKRGYKGGKKENEDKKQREYVAKVENRYKTISNLHETIGQYFAKKLKDSEVIGKKGKAYCTFRIKDQVFPRKAYEEEYYQIMDCQKEFYPEILTDKFISHLHDNIIFYQRGLKSTKHLVSLCDLEKRQYYDKNYKGKEVRLVYDGPRVAARSNPLFQLCAIWERVNNLTFRNRRGEKLVIPLEQKREIVDFLNTHEVMILNDVQQILGIDKKDGWWADKSIRRGIKGNKTLSDLREALGVSNDNPMLKMNITLVDSGMVDEETGEVLQMVSPKVVNEPLYKLWHTLYSSKSKKELASAVGKLFNITDKETINRLWRIDFTSPGYANKSVKVIRKILPYLQLGVKEYDAEEYAGYKHLGSLTKEEINRLPLAKSLKQIKKGELRQPVVEKILNQMINVVNAIIKRYGSPDEIHVELARELKQSREERFATYKRINEIEDEKTIIKDILKKKINIDATNKNILRYRLWEETGHVCAYCGNEIKDVDYIKGNWEIEHIIPKSMLFDNSFSNKICSCRKCNKEKDNRTAYDYMESKDEEKFKDYLARVEKWYKDGKISKTKRTNLLTPGNKLPENPIERDLRLTQYISRKAIEILLKVCHNIVPTNGSVTDFLRRQWDYDNILESINMKRYKKAGLVEDKKVKRNGRTRTIKAIKDWSKRCDHRHHAIDALVIAMTKQAFIQRLNELNASREVMYADVKSQPEGWQKKYSLLEEWTQTRKHFSKDEVTEKVNNAVVSFKQGKKVVSYSKRYTYKHGKRELKQSHILTPRGPLHADNVYGMIERNGKKEIVIKYKLGVGRKFLFSGKEKYDERKNKKGKVTITDGIKNVLDSIVDDGIRKRILDRLNEGFTEGKGYKSDPKRALDNLSNLDENPIYADESNTMVIRSVRCVTGDTTFVPLRYNEQGKPIGFALPNNNHHVAIYKDNDGQWHESIVTFWQAVERERYGLPTVIDDGDSISEQINVKELPQDIRDRLPQSGWHCVLSMRQNEMFVLGMKDKDFEKALANKDYAKLNEYLYRVQYLSSGDYWFCLNTVTKFESKQNNRADKRFLRIRTINSLISLNPHKVKVTLLGDVII